MKKILALALFAVALVSCRQTMQTDGFKLSGHLEGLQVGGRESLSARRPRRL